MSNIFNRLHPFYDNTRSILLRLLIIGGLVAFILIVFQPFGTEKFQHPHKNLYLAGHGIIAALAFGFVMLILPRLFPKDFIEEKWVVWKQILLFGFGFILSFLGSYFYMNWFFDQSFHLHNFISFFSVVSIIGLFPTMIITLLDNNRRHRKNRQTAENLTEKITHLEQKKETIQLTDENGNPAFEVTADNLVFIQAASNYVEVHYLENDNLKKVLIRNSLSKIEKQLPFDYFKKCHRSYLANLNLIEKITGNAQGYRLHFPFSKEITVPVSRSKGKELMKVLGTGF